MYPAFFSIFVSLLATLKYHVTMLQQVIYSTLPNLKCLFRVRLHIGKSQLLQELVGKNNDNDHNDDL